MEINKVFEQIDADHIQAFIEDGQEENLFLDFKTINKPDMTRDDRKTLAKALSGFANSSGGLVVWGVDARKNEQGIDCANKAKEVEKVSLFLSKLNQFTGDLVNPIVEGVMHKKIVTSGDKGFAVSLMPPSDAGPHMAKGGEDRYFKRSGDSFYKMEHFDIEDMFGRRKKPNLQLVTRIIPWSPMWTDDGARKDRLQIILGIKNSGRGSARAPFFAFTCNPPYYEHMGGIDEYGNFGLPKLLRSRGTNEIMYGGSSKYVIHPGTMIDVTTILAHIDEGETNVPDLEISFKIGAEEMRLVKDEKGIPGKDLLSAIE